jgi:hypothetical protein
VARLDTCVTVVDAAEFHNNLESMKAYDSEEEEGTIAELMMEQGGFQLEFVSISQVLNNMTCYNLSALIGGKSF